jgi:RNA polymerase sigma factor (sigma-70 family)
VQSLIEQIRTEGNRPLESVYHDHRTEFIQWARHQYRIDEDDAIEIFQQTVIALYENITQGKLMELTSSLKTYLFSIGKNKIMELKRYQERQVKADGLDLPESETPDQDHLHQAVKKSLDQLGEPCRSLLIDFYYNGTSMLKLAEIYGYRNEDTAKSQKYRCLKSLREIFNGMKVTHEA